jgi:hypothetical protein
MQARGKTSMARQNIQADKRKQIEHRKCANKFKQQLKQSNRSSNQTNQANKQTKQANRPSKQTDRTIKQIKQTNRSNKQADQTNKQIKQQQIATGSV